LCGDFLLVWTTLPEDGQLLIVPAFQASFALVALAFLPFLPESPRFLLAKERYEEADEVLAALADAPINDAGVQADKAAILTTIAHEDAKGQFSFLSIIYDKSGQKINIRILLAMSIQMLQEMPGINMVFYYSSVLFIGLGIADQTALVLGGVTSVSFWLGSVLGIFLVDKIGRKNLLYSGSITMLIGYCVYAPMISHGGDTQLWVAFGATCLVVAACGWSWLSV
jgi:MFS family permease